MKIALLMSLVTLCTFSTQLLASKGLETHDDGPNFNANAIPPPRAMAAPANGIGPGAGLVVDVEEEKAKERLKKAEKIGRLLRSALEGKVQPIDSLYTGAAKEIVKRDKEGGAALARIFKHMLTHREEIALQLMDDPKVIQNIFGKQDTSSGRYYARLVKWAIQARRMAPNGNPVAIALPPFSNGLEDDAEAQDNKRLAQQFKTGFLEELNSKK